MNKGGIGVGSASIVLVFSVLCLTVFSLITFVVSGNDKNLIDAEARLITGYYEADTQAELILDEILKAGDIPGSIRDIEIGFERDMVTGETILSYHCPVTDNKALFVSLLLTDDSYQILNWKLLDTEVWEFDNSLNVWLGDE